MKILCLLMCTMISIGSFVKGEGSSCQTPEGEEGTVKYIRNCKHMMKLVNRRTPKDLAYIRASRVGESLNVCCGPVPSENTLCDSQISLPPHPDSRCCGIDLSAGDKIWGGKTTSIEQYPWTVVLEHIEPKTGVTKLNCGGSLISSTHVVTAAHCIKGGRAWPPKNVRVGEFDTSNPGKDCQELPEDEGKICNDGAITIPIESILLHPEYQARHTLNDIALIKLKHGVKYTDFIRPICLPSSDWTTMGERQFIVTGWGRVNDTHSRSIYKQAVKVPLMNLEECFKKSSRRALSKRQICAGGEEGKDSCTGDSGGPLMADSDHNDHIELAGIVSYGLSKCATKDMPGVYTNVYSYIDWINKNVREHSGRWFKP